MMVGRGVVSVLCLLVASTRVALAQDEGTPVGKVVELIQELKDKLEADGVAEQQLYDKFACWCEETTSRKAQAITQAMSDIKRLGTTILEKKGTTAIRGQEISDLKSLIRDNEDAQAEATTMREKSNKNYLDNKGEMETTIGALEKGILALSGAGTKRASLLEQKAAMKAMAKNIHKAIRVLPPVSMLSPKQVKVLEVFLEDPAEYYDQKAKKKEAYAPQSATIQGILKDMYDTFVKNLEKETLTESDQVQGFEDLMAIKAKEHASFSTELKHKSLQKGDAEASLADASQELDDTSNLMAADTKFFEQTKAQCTTKADEWGERARARTEELAGIDKGIAILTSDDAKALFSKAIKPGSETFAQKESSVSLMQVSSEDEVRLRAVEVLRRRARTTGSLRLAALAAELRGNGHFDIVIEQIEKMRDVLHKEEQDDIDKRDWCKAETFKNEEEASKYEYKVEKADAKISKLGGKLEQLETSLKSTNSEIGDTLKAIGELEDERKEDHKVFEECKADDEGAVKLLEQAIGALSSFYKNNKGTDMGEVQGSTQLLQKEPEYNDKDTAPDATFSEAGKSKGESKGIVAILTMLKEDLEDEISNGVKNEVEAQTGFEEDMGAAKATLQRLNDKKTNTKNAIATNNQSTDDTEDDKDAAQGLKEDEEKYLSEIKPDCDWMLENFQARKDARAQEDEGLDEAKAMLNGAGFALAQVSEKRAAFLQRA